MGLIDEIKNGKIRIYHEDRIFKPDKIIDELKYTLESERPYITFKNISHSLEGQAGIATLSHLLFEWYDLQVDKEPKFHLDADINTLDSRFDYSTYNESQIVKGIDGLDHLIDYEKVFFKTMVHEHVLRESLLKRSMPIPEDIDAEKAVEELSGYVLIGTKEQLKRYYDRGTDSPGFFLS